MGFEAAYQAWLQKHIRSCTGERRNRLERGHGHGERMFLMRIWYALVGNFDFLHPEYEVRDWRGNPYYLDLVWICGTLKLVIEIKGYGPHVQRTDRIRYRRELNREIYLQVMGYRIIAVPYDELEENPEMILGFFRALLSPLMTLADKKEDYTLIEREILRLAARWDGPLRPIDVVNEAKVCRRTAVKYLKLLCDKGRLQPHLSAGEAIRVCSYGYIPSLHQEW
ncbi:hypothetical protein [Paenibacillus daejeonensis]|uniref:hypothetical protein n=1 Tax=Paenibacillus daejeonensis TaxID=135193 RepID=UPI000363EEFF|nr:hypothetical protein [Paenibacillus daejeonensis]